MNDKVIYRTRIKSPFVIKTTDIDGLYRITAPCIPKCFSGSMKNLRLLKEIAEMMALAYKAGKADLAKMF